VAVSIRFYILAPDGLQRISHRLMEGLCHGEDAMPQFANTKQKVATGPQMAAVSRAVKLKRGTYPDPTGNASYFYIDVGHRETGIDHAIKVIRDDAARAAEAAAAQGAINALDTTISDWVVETLIQGA
jgi:hypothetical protein